MGRLAVGIFPAFASAFNAQNHRLLGPGLTMPTLLSPPPRDRINSAASSAKSPAWPRMKSTKAPTAEKSSSNPKPGPRQATPTAAGGTGEPLPPSRLNEIMGWGGRILALALVYAATGLAGMQLPDYIGKFTLLWLPAGFAVAALWRWGFKLWPGVYFGSLLISVVYNDVWPKGITNGFANTVSAVACVYLLRRWKFVDSLHGARNILVLAAAATGGTLVGSSLGSLAQLLLGRDDILHFWLRWWQSDTTGVLLLTPVLLTAGPVAWKILRERKLEFLLWADVALALGALHFWNTPLPLLFLTAIPLVWAAMRFGRFGTALAIFLLGTCGVVSVALGRGQLATTDSRAALLVVSLYLVGILILAWLVNVLQCENETKEAALRASETRYQRAEGATRDGLWEWNIVTGEDYCSPRWLEMLGYAPGDLAPHFAVISELIHPDDLPRVMAESDASIRARRPFKVDMRLRCKDGHYLWVLSRGRIELDADGKPVRMTGSISDISERWKAEEALRQSEARYHRAEQGANDGLWEWNIATGEDYFSPRCLEMLGLLPGDVLPGNLAGFKKLIHPEDQVRVWAEINQKREDGRPFNVEMRVRRQAGDHLWVLLRGRVEKNGNGKPIYMTGTFSDITERRRTEEALRESEARYRRVERGTNEGLWERNFVTGEDYRSPRWLEILGYAPGDLAPNYDAVSELFHPDDKAEILAKTELGLKNGGPISLEARMRRKNGQYLWVLARAMVELDAAGRPLRMSGSISDISERKKREAEKELMEGRTRQLQKSESLTRMAGAIAHHFNNQLQAVTGKLEMALQDLPAGTDANQNLLQALQSTRKAAELSSLMLTYVGQEIAHGDPVDLATTSSEILSLLSPVMPPGVTLETDLPSPGPIVGVSAQQISQVLTNLVTNAWEACHKAGGAVSVTVKTVAAGDIPEANRVPAGWQARASAYGCLEVADTGEGIARENLEKLFEPFYSTKFVGRGLGLAVVLGIVRGGQGAVIVESESGVGSVFRVFLPLSVKTVPSKLALSRGKSKPTGTNTVLVVEDEPTVRNFLAYALKRAGFAVLEAADGSEAVKLFGRHQATIDCVLCDVSMPGMNGWETLTALRQLAPDLPAILASGYTEAQVMAGEHSERPQAFLQKPFDLRAVVDTVTQLLAPKS